MLLVYYYKNAPKSGWLRVYGHTGDSLDGKKFVPHHHSLFKKTIVSIQVHEFSINSVILLNSRRTLSK